MNDTNSILLACPQCEKRLRVPARAAGKHIRCPQCTTVVEVPLPVPAGAATVDSAPSFQQRLQGLLAEYHAAIAAGQASSVHELLHRHPELEPDLAQAFIETAQNQATLAPPSPTSPNHGAPGPTLSAPAAAGPVAVPRAGHFGDYELLEELARGGMGVVFKAHQKSMGRVVALKMILAGTFASPDQLRRFHLEAEEAGRLDHPHIVPIYQVGEYGGQHYFTMKLVEGGCLNQHNGRFRGKPRAAAQLIATVARAVHHAHQRGILHRDLKPGNILLDHEGQPHVTDFGLAKHLGARDSDTQSGAILGTPSYMAPEQAAARKDLSTAVDVYALGAVLYELLTGRPPFLAATSFDTLLQVLEKEPKRPHSLNAKVDHDLDTICLKCLAKEPSRRYSSAEGLARDLEHWLAGEPIQARRVGTLERVRKWVRRRPAVAALAVVSAVAAVGLALLGWVDSLRLQSAWHSAEANAAEARQQRDEANAGFRKRQETVDALLIRIDRRLENYGSSVSSVRSEFLNEFLKLNDRLMQERGQEPEVRRQAAQLHQRVADLHAQRNETRDGEAEYQQTIALYQGLMKDGVASEDDRLQLAYTYAQVAQLQRRTRRYAPAQAAYEEAIRVREQLVVDFPLNPVHRYRTATYRALLADLLEEQGRLQEAEALYRRALADQEQLVQGYPNADYRQGLFETAGSLAVMLEATRPDEAQRLLEQIAHGHWQAGQANPRDIPGIVNSGYDLAQHLRRRGRHADLARFGAEIAGQFSTSREIHYHAACYVARAVPALDIDHGLTADDRQQLADTYAGKAVELLRRAVQLGWNDREQIFLDADLDPLRPRSDFHDLLADLDRRIGRPLALDQLVRNLANRYANEQRQYQATLASARTIAERKKAGGNRPRPEEYAQRFLALAEEHSRDAAAVPALGQVLMIASSGPLAWSPAGPRLRKRAFEVLERDHLQTPAFADVCPVLGNAPTGEGDRLLRTAFEKHTLPEVRAQAGFWLARSLARRAEGAGTFPAAKSAAAFRLAEEQFEKVARDYGTLPHGTTTLGEAARTQLHALRHLAIGRLAEDITGLDVAGRPMKLSDFRGKVVLLDFWANWCGYCRQMYPYEKALTARLRNRPFVLLGVNSDKDQQELQREVKRRGITWPSWWDADKRIGSRWQVQGLPMMYLIDHRGVIRQRYMGLTRGDVIDAAVEQLLKECPPQTARR